MHVLCLDDAGSVGNPNEQHFVLAGASLPERQIHWLTKALDEVAGDTGHFDPSHLELPGNQILAGRGSEWPRMRPSNRRRVVREELCAAFALKPEHQWRWFGVVVHMAARSPEDPVKHVFERLANRVERFVAGNNPQGNQRDRGPIVLDQSTRETRLQALAAECKDSGIVGEHCSHRISHPRGRVAQHAAAQPKRRATR